MAQIRLPDFEQVRLAALALRRLSLRVRLGVCFAEDVDLSLTTRFISNRRGSIRIGPSSAIALNALVVSLREDGTTGPVSIGGKCFIGAGAMICPGVTIGDGVVVAAGSVVRHDIPGDCVISGNPARVVRRTIGAGRYGRLPEAWANQRLMEAAQAVRQGRISRQRAPATSRSDGSG